MKRIAVRAPQWLGDAVISTVFLERLKQRNPGASLSVLCYPSLAPVYEGHPSLEAVITLPSKESRSVSAVAGIIRAGRFDEIYILPRSLRTALEAWRGGVPKRVGFATDWRSLFLTNRFPYSHHIWLARRYLRLIGEDELPADKMKAYYPSSANMPEPSLKKPVLGLAPWSLAPARTWIPERFVEVANNFLSSYGGSVMLFGSAGEREASAALHKHIKGPLVDTTGGLDLLQLGAMIRHCDAMLVNDSGLMHIAAACNVPTVAVFGGGDLRQALPPFGRCVGVWHPEVPCVPCLRNHCVRFGEYNMECMKKVTSNEVFDALRTLLAGV